MVVAVVVGGKTVNNTLQLCKRSRKFFRFLTIKPHKNFNKVSGFALRYYYAKEQTKARLN